MSAALVVLAALAGFVYGYRYATKRMPLPPNSAMISALQVKAYTDGESHGYARGCVDGREQERADGITRARIADELLNATREVE